MLTCSLQPSESNKIWPFSWLSLILFVLAAFLLFLWLRSRKQVKLISKKRLLSLEKFCEGHGISRREMEVMCLLIAGKSNHEIEKELFISKNTVRNHIHNIYGKLRVRNRVELVNKVQESTAGDSL